MRKKERSSWEGQFLGRTKIWTPSRPFSALPWGTLHQEPGLPPGQLGTWGGSGGTTELSETQVLPWRAGARVWMEAGQRSGSWDTGRDTPALASLGPETLDKSRRLIEVRVPSL